MTNFGAPVSCGSAGEPGVLGKCQQPGAVSVEVHALISIQIGKQCHQFHGDSLPSSSAWRLLI